jgi:hypothetical protein
MELEIIMLSEVSQAWKDKDHIFSHMSMYVHIFIYI